MNADDDLAERWLMAAVTLDADPSARVECPACGLESLRFVDCPSGPRPLDAGAMVGRALRCGFCGAEAAAGRRSV